MEGNSDVIMAILSVSFLAWAGVVGWIGQGIRSDLKGLSTDLSKQASRLNDYIVQTESRLSVLEDRVNLIRQKKKEEK